MLIKKPVISVIIPTYNRCNTISEAIKSAIKQTYGNLQIIVIDDGSTDKTEKIVKKINDKRIVYLTHYKNKGASAARNTGIKNAKGDYIAFLDSDDWWLPNKLKLQLALLDKNKKPAVCYCSFYILKNNHKIIAKFPEIKEYSGRLDKQLMIGNFITTSSLLVKKKVFDQVGLFDEAFPAYQDWDFLLRASKIFSFAYVDLPLVIQNRDSENRIQADSDKRTKAVKLLLEKHKNEIKKDRHLYARFLSMAGWRVKAWLVEPENLRFLKEVFVKPSVPKDFF